MQIDTYVEDGFTRCGARAPARVAASVGDRCRRTFFEALGLVRLRGTIQYPGVAHARPEDHLVSRVREIRTHGLNGGLANSQSLTGHK